MRQQKSTLAKGNSLKLKDIAVLITLLVSLVIAVYAGIVYGKRIMDYNLSDDEYDALLSEFVVSPTDSVEESTNAGDDADQKSRDRSLEIQKEESLPIDIPQIDWKGLKEVNGDIIGWLDVPAVGISYPVVQGGDNQEYLHKTVSGEWRTAGSIFLDSEVSPDMTDCHSIIYGHNMRNGSMFAPIRQFNVKGVYDDCPYFWFCTDRKNLLYQIISVHVAITEDESYSLFPSSLHNQDFVTWMENEMKKSQIACTMPAHYIKRVVTLSTCTPSSDNTRQLVQGILIRELRTEE